MLALQALVNIGHTRIVGPKTRDLEPLNGTRDQGPHKWDLGRGT